MAFEQRRSRQAVLAVELVLVLTATLAFAEAAMAAEGPIPVSPGRMGRAAVVEARCPTFQWAGVPGAGGYELAVFRIPDAETADGAEPVLVTRASVPGDARGFTPSSADCLERGQRYAWSVAAAQDSAATGEAGEPQWSQPFLFQVGAAPSLDEVEQAIATLQRYREHLGDDSAASAARVSASADAAIEVPSPRAPLRTREPRTPLASDSLLPGPLTAPTSGVVRVASAATPTIGTPSLRVSANIALGASSNLFKNDEVFLWDDTSGNTALGRNALATATGNATNNTAVGRDALRYTVQGGGGLQGSFNTAVGDNALRHNTTGAFNTAVGDNALRNNTTGQQNTAIGYRALLTNRTGVRNTAIGYHALGANYTGSYNTASGDRALYSNTSGIANTANGHRALRLNTTGSDNTAIGNRALEANTTGYLNTAIGHNALHSNGDGIRNTASGFTALGQNTSGSRNTASGDAALNSNTTGSRNTAIGYRAGQQPTTGDDNIFIGSGAQGGVGDTKTIRIGGTISGDGPAQQNRTFINGIRGIAPAGDDPVPVLIDAVGQLGTENSSLAVKQDVQDLGALADRLLELRPVAFRYKQHAALDPDTPLQFGLIAEEVAKVFPELVVFDREGRAQTVKYHLLSRLLLGELQRHHAELQRQQEDVQRQRAELRILHARLDSIEKNPREPNRRRGDARSVRK
jgi:hypothetical protein